MATRRSTRRRSTRSSTAAAAAAKSMMTQPKDPPMIPGEFLLAEDPIVANVGRATLTLEVTNTGDRPVQVGSHYHFFEVNRALDFNRAASFGMRLNIPSGNAIRFEPGQTHTVTLVALGGKGSVYGFNTLTEGSVRSSLRKQVALKALDEWLPIQ